MAFQGLLYSASYDPMAIPLMPRETMISLNSDLLEEVKDVLIPAEKLRIEHNQIIGKGKHVWCHKVVTVRITNVQYVNVSMSI